MPSTDVSTSRCPDASESPNEKATERNGQASAKDASSPTEAPRLFGGLTAAEAGRRSALSRAERELAGETEAAHARRDEVLLIRCTAPTGAIIDRLSRDAKQGNVQAARELRAWLSELPVETDTDLSTLDRRTRQQVLARVLREIEEDERAAELVSVTGSVTAELRL